MGPGSRDGGKAEKGWRWGTTMASSPAMTSAMGKDSPGVADEAQRYALHAEGGQRPRHVEAFAVTARSGQ